MKLRNEDSYYHNGKTQRSPIRSRWGCVLLVAAVCTIAVGFVISFGPGFFWEPHHHRLGGAVVTNGLECANIGR